MEILQPPRNKMKEEQNEDLLVPSILKGDCPKSTDNHSLEDQITRDSEHLCSLLPKKLWIHVIYQLEDSPNELSQLSNASPYFRKLLLSKRVEFLFPQILPLILTEIVHRSGPGYIVGWEHLLRKDYEGQEKPPTFYSLRLICSTWANAVDACLHNSYQWIEKNFHFHLVTSYNFITGHRRMFNAFLRHFKATHPKNSQRSPFVIRNVSIRFIDRRVADVPVFTKKISTMLEKYGQHVWNLKLDIPDDLSCSKLRHGLRNVPNLKSLVIKYDRPPVEFKEPGQLEEKEAKEFPLPHFHDLETLCTDILPTLFFNELIHQCDRISTLKIVHNGGYHKGNNLFAVPLPNLDTLEMSNCAPEDVLNVIMSPGGTKWPLTSLKIVYSDLEFIKWSEIFQAIQDKWGNSLESLTIQLPEGNSSEEAKSILKDSWSFRWKLPKLRDLELWIANPIHLDFLLPMEDSLEYLKIKLLYSTQFPLKRRKLAEETYSPSVQLIGFEREMLESDIWELLPNLENVVILRGHMDAIHYTREKWMELE